MTTEYSSGVPKELRHTLHLLAPYSFGYASSCRLSERSLCCGPYNASIAAGRTLWTSLNALPGYKPKDGL